MKYYYCDGLVDPEERKLDKEDFVLGYDIITDESGKKTGIVIRYPKRKATIDYSIQAEEQLLIKMRYQAKSCTEYAKSGWLVGNSKFYMGSATLILGESLLPPEARLLAIIGCVAFYTFGIIGRLKVSDAKKNALFIIIESRTNGVDPGLLSHRVKKVMKGKESITINDIDPLTYNDVLAMQKQIQRGKFY